MPDTLPQPEIFEFPIRPTAVIENQFAALNFTKESDNFINSLDPNSVISRDLRLVSIGIEVARNALFTSGEITPQDCTVLQEVLSERARYQHKLTDGLRVNFDTTAKRMLLEIGVTLLVGLSSGAARNQVEIQHMRHQAMSGQIRDVQAKRNSPLSISRRAVIAELGFVTASTYVDEDGATGFALTSTVQEDDGTIPEWWKNTNQPWQSFDIVAFQISADGELKPDLRRIEVKGTNHWPKSVSRGAKEAAGIAGFTQLELLGVHPDRVRSRSLFGVGQKPEAARARTRARMEARGYKVSRVAEK